jgi:hypothetical protein
VYGAIYGILNFISKAACLSAGSGLKLDFEVLDVVLQHTSVKVMFLGDTKTTILKIKTKRKLIIIQILP